MVSDFFLTKDIVGNFSKNRAIEEIALFLSQILEADTNAVLESIIQREQIQNTGLEKSIAVPHAFIPNISQAYLAVVSFDNPIPDWICVDNSYVERVLCLVLPLSYTKDTANITLLTKVFQCLSDESVMSEIQSQQDSQKIVEILNIQIRKEGYMNGGC
ncbi:PTS sugar transporter subunit IIA [Streptococcus suis]|nr:PTS sugar transporter subunit IIA [Streptococcus suis]